VLRKDIRPESGLEVLMTSEKTGLCMVAEKRANRLYMFNHVEYDSTSLADEYFRDRAAGVEIKLPENYFPEDDPTRVPLNRWRSHAHLLFGNWINQVYQTTEYDLARVGIPAKVLEEA
jgi:homoserine O-succinyltransferase